MENCSSAAAFLSVPISLSLFCPVTLSFISHHQSGCYHVLLCSHPKQDSWLTQQKPSPPCGPWPSPSTLYLPPCFPLPSLPAFTAGLLSPTSGPLPLLFPLPGHFPSWPISHLAIHRAHCSPPSCLNQMSTIRKASLSSLFVTIFPQTRTPEPVPCFISVVLFFIAFITAWPYVIHLDVCVSACLHSHLCSKESGMFV